MFRGIRGHRRYGILALVTKPPTALKRATLIRHTEHRLQVVVSTLPWWYWAELRSRLEFLPRCWNLKARRTLWPLESMSVSSLPAAGKPGKASRLT
jgi:hypothetical protein